MTCARARLLLVAALGVAACAGAADPGARDEQAISPIDRMIIGEANRYPPDGSLRDKLAVLDASQAARRQAAWGVVAKALAPVGVKAGGVKGSLPRFQTWYSKDDFVPMFDKLFRGLSPEQRRARAPFSAGAIEGVFPWNATMATSLASWSEERFQKRLEDLNDDEGVHSLGRSTRTLMSPAVVGHVLGSYGNVLECMKSVAAGEDATSFAPCYRAELPIDAAMAKVRWIPSDTPMPTYDTSAASLRRKLADGAWGEGDGSSDPGPQDIYTMRLSKTEGMRLAALHIVTKELRDWVWITLWWSPDPNADFGADRPESVTALGGPWKNYKMCVVTAYDESDPDPRSGRDDSLGDALLAAREAGGAPSWCSNPYIELEARNATTNCIGCHQHAGTKLSTSAILGDEQAFPMNGRTKLRANFPADYVWALTGNVDLGNAIRAKVEALTP